MSLPSLIRSPKEAIVIFILAFATAAKAMWALNSGGSCDAILFYIYGQELQHATLAFYYQHRPIFNHTPLTASLVQGLYALANGNYDFFAAALRFLCIFADIALVAGLLHVRRLTGRPPWWALYLFAASPVSIMVSGFHGNVDPLMVVLLFFAVVALLQERPAWCGVLFAASCNIKVVPLFLVPAFFFYWCARGRQPALRFTVSAGTLLLLGAAWPLLQCPAPFLQHVLGYGSVWGSWGLTYWLRLTGAPDLQAVDFQGLSQMQYHIMGVLKWVVIAGAVTLAWRRRAVVPLEFFTTVGAAFVLLFTFAPGAGVQYMTWFAPFLLILSARWWVALTVGSSAYMFAFYHSTSKFHFPWDVAFPRGTEVPYWAPWTNLPWITFVALLCCRGASWYLLRPQQAAVRGSDSEEHDSPRGFPVETAVPLQIEGA